MLMKKSRTMMPKIHNCHFSDLARRIAVFVQFAAVCAFADAQSRLELVPAVNQSVGAFSLGLGSAASLETYLSPSEYAGPYVSGEYEHLSLKDTDGFFPYRLLYLNFGTGFLENHVGTSTSMHVMAHGYYSWLHQLVSGPVWESMLGISALADVGGMMKSSNSNNPATAQVQLSSGATFDNVLHFRIGKLPMAAKGTLNLPLLGLGFAPDHDQFYWNLVSQGGVSNDIYVVTPFSAQTFQARFALDVPVKGRVVQLGYDFYLMRNRLGGNFSGLVHSYATIGLVHRFEKLKWK